MEHEAADILGHSDSLVPPMPQEKPLIASPTLTAFVLLAVWLAYAFGKRLWTRVLLWRENTHKLAMRRRHGIPDSDLRPFNVAYADAMAKAQQEEHANTSRASLRPRPRAHDHSDALPDPNLRQRPAPLQNGTRHSTAPVPGRFSSQDRIHRLETSLEPHSRRSEANRLPTSEHTHLLPRAFTQHDYDRAGEDTDMDDRKRGLEEDLDQPELKRSRVEADELVDGNEDIAFQDEMEIPVRGSKRGLGDEDHDDTATKKARGKRARKVSAEKRPLTNVNMDVDEDEQMDEVPELKSHVRGKKRDREEAASTFGGDESEAEPEPENTTLHRRQRKRRTVAKRQSEASYLRGKKRDREGNENLSDDESSDGSPVQRKKRGRRPALMDQNKESDVSMDESTISTRGKTRNIGDEWESNGIRWKIGPNGQRLRQALVKKARQKFPMPKDSQHPDRRANLQVCIEAWLTEEEYQDVKSKHMLAWQDSPKKDDADLSIDTESVPFPSGALGKSLLWSASAASTPSGSPASAVTYDLPAAPRTRSQPRHSIATSVGVSFNPFVDSSMSSVRRIASSSRATSLKSEAAATAAEAANGSPRSPKAFSKWEKQELEANAMMKIRTANLKKEEERNAKLRAEREKVEREKQERERQERERQERELADRLAKQKAEADKAKEAAVPKITVTAPSLESVTQPGGTSSNLFAPKTEPGSSTSTTVPPAATGSSIPNFFAKPAQPQLFGSTPIQPASFGGTPISTSSNPLLGRVGPLGSDPTKQGEALKSTPDPPPQFSFKQAGTAPLPSAAPTTNNAAASSTPSTNGPKFTFNLSKTATSTPSSTAPTTTPFPSVPAPTTTSEPPKPSTGPTFTFKLPGAPASGISPTAPAPTTTTPSAPLNANATSAPKFTFNTPSAGSAPSSTGPTSVFGSTTTGAPTSAFGNPSITPAANKTQNPFGTSSGTNVFGGGSTTPASSPFGATGTSTTPSSSSLFGAMGTSSSSTPASNPFGGSGATTSTTPASNTFGATSSATTVGSTSSKPAEGPKFSFGTAPATNGSASGSSSAPAAGSSNGSTFSFGSGSALGAGKTGSIFGTPSTPSQGPAPSTTPASTPATGAGSNTGGFSFKFTGGQSTTPSSSPFGTTTAGGGASAENRLFGGAFAAAAKTNGAASGSTPAGSSSLFGTGGSSGAPSNVFGSTSSLGQK